MKTIINTFSLLFLFTINSISAQWVEQFDTQNFISLDRVFFLNENLGWAAGGVYFYTIDGGINWYLDGNWNDNIARDIFFVNPDIGFIGGGISYIKKTINGGQSWEIIDTPIEKAVRKFFFADENNGWATLGQYNNGNILHTIDGGETWEVQDVIQQSEEGTTGNLFFINDTVGWASGAYYIGDVYYVVINRTIDGGNTWNTIFTILNGHYFIHDMFFTDSLSGWIVGEKGGQNKYFVLHTNDGGESWEEQELSTELLTYNVEIMTVYCAYFINETTGWLGVSANNGNGFVYCTIDGGENWEIQDNFYYPINDIQIFNGNLGWAVGEDFIYHTENADSYIWLGEEELALEAKSLKISPNPSNGFINIDYRSQSEFIIKIYSLWGETLYEKKISKNTDNQNQLDISHLVSATYLIQLINEEEIITEKIIINK